MSKTHLMYYDAWIDIKYSEFACTYNPDIWLEIICESNWNWRNPYKMELPLEVISKANNRVWSKFKVEKLSENCEV